MSGKMSPDVAYQDDIFLTEPDDHQEVQTFYNGSGADIPAGSACLIDVTQTTTTLGHGIKISGATLGLDAALFVGIAKETIVDGTAGQVINEGLRVDAAVGATTVAGSPLTTGAVAGQLDLAVLGTHHILAVALEADTANLAKVRVLRQ